jgi:hypothetical protein
LVLISDSNWNDFLGDFLDSFDGNFLGFLGFISNDDWNNFLGFLFVFGDDWDNSIFLWCLFGYWKWIDLDDIVDNWDLFWLDNQSDAWNHFDDLHLSLIFRNNWNNFLDDFLIGFDNSGNNSIFLWCLFGYGDGKWTDLDDIYDNREDRFFGDNGFDDWSQLDDLFFFLNGHGSDGLNGSDGFVNFLLIGNLLDGQEFNDSLRLIGFNRNDWHLDNVGLDWNGFGDWNGFIDNGLSNLESGFGNLDGLNDFLLNFLFIFGDVNHLDGFLYFGRFGHNGHGLDCGFLGDFNDGHRLGWFLILNESSGYHQRAKFWLDEIDIGLLLLGRLVLGLSDGT